MQEYSKISIITPTYNAARVIAACLESVAQQGYPHLEHWIIDGLSKDNTLSIVQEYAQRYPHIKYISEKDQGIYDAMNKGIDLAAGDFLLFLGADDMLASDVLNTFTKNIEFGDYDLVYGKVQYPDLTCGAEYKAELLTEELLLNPFVHLFMHHQGTFIRKTLFQIFGKYDLQYPIGADVHFFIKTMHHPKVKKLFFDSTISLLGDTGASSQQEEIKLRYDFPALAQKHLQVHINQKSYYRNFAKYYFEDIYKKNLLKGLKGIAGLILAQGDLRYYLGHSAYWLKRRFFDK